MAGEPLQWRPVAFKQEEGDYQIKRIKFAGPDERVVEAELAAIPTADWGDVPGDLIALRLNSTNEKADCGTVLCSEAGGCMRMETKGGAQTDWFNQVTPLLDQVTNSCRVSTCRVGPRCALRRKFGSDGSNAEVS